MDLNARNNFNSPSDCLYFMSSQSIKTSIFFLSLEWGLALKNSQLQLIFRYYTQMGQTQEQIRFYLILRSSMVQKLVFRNESHIYKWTFGASLLVVPQVLCFFFSSGGDSFSLYQRESDWSKLLWKRFSKWVMTHLNARISNHKNAIFLY